MSHVLKHNVADQIAYFRAYDTDGTAKTDLDSSTAGLTLSVFRVGATSVSIASLSDKAADDSTHADGAIRNVGGNLYTIDIPDAATATQVPSIVVRGSYTGGVVEGLEHPIVAYDPAVNYASATKAADIETDTQDIQSRLPAALSSGLMQSTIQGASNQAIDIIQSRIASSIASGLTNWPTAIGTMADAVYDEPYAGHTTAGTYGKLFDTIRKSNLSVEGEVTSAITPTTLTFASTVSATSSAYAHAVLLFVSGPLAGENSPIVSYTSTNGVIVLEEPLTAAPSAGDEFVIIAGSHVHSVVDIQQGLATSAELTEIKGATWSASTDTLEAIRDATGGGGGTTIIPAASFAPTRTDTTNLIAYVGETISQVLVVYEADGTTPLDLSGKTLTVIFEDMEETDTGVVASASVTVSGDNSNVVTFAYPVAVTDEVGQFRYALRDEAAPKAVYSQGLLLVKAAANKDA